MEKWFLTAGDFGYFWPEQIKSFSWLPNVYPQLLTLWFEYPYTVFLKILSGIGLSWWVIEKLVWVSVLVIALFSSYRLAKYVIGKNIFAFAAPLIYIFNTYFLLLVSGGQLGVAWANAFAPWVLLKFMETVDTPKKFTLRQSIRNGLLFALLVAFDLRIAYLTLGAMALYAALHLRRETMLTLIVPVFVAASLHLYWILPTVLASRGVASLGEQFTNPGMLSFLSFADFSHAISLLHPNWPDNLFGKVYFLQPEFLVLPILAFSALLFVKKDKRITFFALLAFIGMFLSKGVNGPFGGIFEWSFVHVPGFVMFRDPTKFYLLTAIGYSVLIPLALNRTGKKTTLLIFVIFWFFSIRAVFQGRVQGVFVTKKLPQEYEKLKDVLVSDPVPSQTLWIPDKEGYAYFSDTHPLVTATSSAAISTSAKYVIVPIDVRKRIFLDDYTYDATLREKIIKSIDLPRVPGFHDLAVFKNPSFSGLNTVLPAVVQKQRELANIGLGISVTFLIGWIVWIYLH